MERIEAKLQDLKTTFVTIDRATALTRARLLKQGATRAQIWEARANLRGDAIDKFLDHLNSWITSRSRC